MSNLKDVMALANKVRQSQLVTKTLPALQASKAVQRAWKYAPPLLAGTVGYASVYDPERARKFAEPFSVPGVQYVDPTALGYGLGSAVLADPHGWAKRYAMAARKGLSPAEAAGKAVLGKTVRLSGAAVTPALLNFASRSSSAMERGTEGITQAMTEIPQTLLRTTRKIEKGTETAMERAGKSAQGATEFFDKLRTTAGQKEMIENGMKLAKALGKDLVGTTEGKVLVGTILALSSGWVGMRAYQSNQLRKAQQAALEAQQLQAAFFKRQLAKME